MNHRAPYCDLVLHNLPLATIEAESLAGEPRMSFPNPHPTVGAIGSAAISQTLLWRKLLLDALGVEPLQLYFEVSPAYLAQFLPRSLLPHAYSAVTPVWPELSASTNSASFALAFKEQAHNLVFVGLPTEEGLDAFLDLARQL